MGVIFRGVKNAFRNTVRTLSVTLILAISIGLALIMLLSYKTVESRIASIQSSIGNTISISPAGARGFEGGGEPLTGTQMAGLKSLDHIVGIDVTLMDRLQPSTDTSLQSAIDPGSLGTRQGNFNRRNNGGPQGQSSTTPRTFTIPISVTGVSNPSALLTGTAKLTTGALFDGSADVNEAVVGAAVATKNNLVVGSTFTAYSTTITVQGIFDAGNEFANSGIYMPITALQRLSTQTDQISSATVNVDNLANIDGVVTAVQGKLGATVADVVSNADSAKSALDPLQNIKKISLYSLIGALVAGAIITLLIMMMIVRERRREIGVLKAIGASNVGVVTQFVTEALVLTLLGAVLGIIVGVSLSNPVLNALVNNSASSTATTGSGPVGGAAGRGFARVAQIGGNFGGSVRSALTGLHNSVGWEIILYGLLAAIGIAIIGSAIPAFLIAKVKPAEVMRGE